MSFVDIMFSDTSWSYTVYVGGELVGNFHNYNKVDIKQILTQSHYRMNHKKMAAKEFYKDFKLTPKQLAAYLNRSVYKATVASLPKPVQTMCFRGKNLDSSRTFKVCSNLDIIEQTISDKNDNLLPFVALQGKSAQELKSFYGKGLWKKLSKQSFSRNKLIANIRNMDVEEIAQIVSLPSGIIKNAGTQTDLASLKTLEWIRVNKEVLIKDCKTKNLDIRKDFNLVRDTTRMARQLGENFSWGWSSRKMEDKHAEFSNEIQKREREKLLKREERFTKPLREGKRNFYGFNGVVGQLCNTYISILDEGKKMHHCVGYYADQCYDGNYLVYHLDGDEEETTLGVSVSKSAKGKKVYSFSQHYGVSNATVKSKNHEFVAKTIIDNLNKEKDNV